MTLSPPPSAAASKPLVTSTNFPIHKPTITFSTSPPSDPDGMIALRPRWLRRPPVDDDVRRLAAQLTAIEDALLIRSTSPLRKGWGDWFEKKSVFLRKDRMFRSNFEVLNPNNNPLLQDPDGVGASGFTRGDRIVQKLWLNEFKKASPLTSKKVLLSINNNKNYNNVDSLKSDRRELRTIG
ncbi:uncharacterized protein DS421_4g119940 [Arachis hypogaea]|nr:uncharacterized protein DS421_4g119940 [Arachis hypogaea]